MEKRRKNHVLPKTLTQQDSCFSGSYYGLLDTPGEIGSKKNHFFSGVQIKKRRKEKRRETLRRKTAPERAVLNCFSGGFFRFWPCRFSQKACGIDHFLFLLARKICESFFRFRRDERCGSVYMSMMSWVRGVLRWLLRTAFNEVRA